LDLILECSEDKEHFLITTSRMKNLVVHWEILTFWVRPRSPVSLLVEEIKVRE